MQEPLSGNTASTRAITPISYVNSLRITSQTGRRSHTKMRNKPCTLLTLFGDRMISQHIAMAFGRILIIDSDNTASR